ncbi:L-seryl-tRNA(Sec) selenium transferase [Nocardioides sp. GXZ039]|uniref:L-seryl-tRNA(Sec) selenium transferase n=1 Tax=Nocardioides sp. GXZ039 TaxID=3136018 RepID=UPI0030F3CA04
MSQDDPRRAIPRTDDLLARPAVHEAAARLGADAVRWVVTTTQERARRGDIGPEAVAEVVESELAGRTALSLRPVLNATGILVHTNLGRAPLSAAARDAVHTAGGYVDVELDLSTGRRSGRGEAARAALLAACPDAEDALVVNNGAAALLLATAALAAGREAVISRGELIEIGAGFRLPELIESGGARLVEVGSTNRTHLVDYVDAVGEHTGCVLKVHPSNYRVEGFTAAVSVSELHQALPQTPVVADLGSGLLHPEPALPDEPDVSSALRAGAALVLVSGDKLLGGPQAGVLFGRADVVSRLRSHPLARALRVDKLTLAAIEATLVGPPPPVRRWLAADPDALRTRTERLATRLRDGGIDVEVVAHDGRVGGGGAPGFPLPGWALRVPVEVAAALRTGEPAVLARLHDGACLIDLRCVEEADDERLLTAVVVASGRP